MHRAHGTHNRDTGAAQPPGFLARLRARLTGRGFPLSEHEFGPPDATGHVQMPLSRMQPGDQGHVLSVCTCCAARQHLMEMGFTPGVAIELVRVAPLGDPLTVRIRGYQLSLRQREAEAVLMRRCPPEWDASPEWHSAPRTQLDTPRGE